MTPPVHLSPSSNTTFGDSIINKDKLHLRLVLQNPNGFSKENDYFSYQLCLQNMKSISADIVLLPETNLKWNDYDVVSTTSKHRRHIFEFSKQITSNSTHTYDSVYQPGGTCSVIIDKLIGRYHSSLNDSNLGRWTITNLSMRNNKKLSIICCYQVCKQHTSSAGPKTAFSQQWSLLKRQGQAHPNPRKQFIEDLDQLLLDLTNHGNTIILAGDFNATIGDEPHGIDRIVSKYNLVDTIQYLHGPHACATYSRGSKCIDYVFCSSSFLPAIQRGAILPFHSIISSDHRPIFLDININQAFQAPLTSLLRPSQRALSSTHSSNCS